MHFARCIRVKAGQFTYWDYFRRAFETNRGIRIDHFLLSPAVAERLERCEIDRGPRGLERPSDHGPPFYRDWRSSYVGSGLRMACHYCAEVEPILTQAKWTGLRLRTRRT